METQTVVVNVILHRRQAADGAAAGLERVLKVYLRFYPRHRTHC